jgi:hypothetical protein
MQFSFSAADAPTMVIAGEFRDDIAGRMTPAQIAAAQKLAQEWLAKHPQ